MESVRLSEYIESLTIEERTKFAPLIEEALQRDRELTDTMAEARRQVALYERHSRHLMETTARFHAGVSRLNRKLADIAGMSERAFREIPCETAAGGCSTLRH